MKTQYKIKVNFSQIAGDKKGLMNASVARVIGTDLTVFLAECLEGKVDEASNNVILMDDPLEPELAGMISRTFPACDLTEAVEKPKKKVGKVRVVKPKEVDPFEGLPLTAALKTQLRKFQADGKGIVKIIDLGDPKP